MPYEPILPSTELVLCKTCEKEGLPLLMPRRSVWRHEKVYHPEQAEPQPAPLEEARAS